jgi:hypothetical protein
VPPCVSLCTALKRLRLLLQPAEKLGFGCSSRLRHSASTVKKLAPVKHSMGSYANACGGSGQGIITRQQIAGDVEDEDCGRQYVLGACCSVGDAVVVFISDFWAGLLPGAQSQAVGGTSTRASSHSPDLLVLRARLHSRRLPRWLPRAQVDLFVRTRRKRPSCSSLPSLSMGSPAAAGGRAHAVRRIHLRVT